MTGRNNNASVHEMALMGFLFSEMTTTTAERITTKYTTVSDREIQKYIGARKLKDMDCAMIKPMSNQTNKEATCTVSPRRRHHTGILDVIYKWLKPLMDRNITQQPEPQQRELRQQESRQQELPQQLSCHHGGCDGS